MAALRDSLGTTLKRKIGAAKAAKGYSWKDIAFMMTRCGMPINASNLMTKMSRSTIRATELVLIMRLLGLHFIDLSDVEVPNIEAALRERDRLPGS